MRGTKRLCYGTKWLLRGTKRLFYGKKRKKSLFYLLWCTKTVNFVLFRSSRPLGSRLTGRWASFLSVTQTVTYTRAHCILATVYREPKGTQGFLLRYYFNPYIKVLKEKLYYKQLQSRGTVLMHKCFYTNNDNDMANSTESSVVS